MNIEFTTSIPITRQDLKVGDVFTKASDKSEVFLTIKFNDENYFVRLSDAEVFEQFMISPEEKLYRYLCTLTVEM